MPYIDKLVRQLYGHEMTKVLFLTTSLGKKLILPTFRLDALVLLRADEAKSWDRNL